MKKVLFFWLLSAATAALAATCELKMLPGEAWWGGAVILGEKMPYTDKSAVSFDMLRKNYGNPAMPVFLSS